MTGTLADALNWAGINEDDFNVALEECTDEADRNRLIMDTLAGTYDEASDAFYRNNEALVESRQLQARLDDALAKLGGSVTNIKNAFLEKFAPALEEAAEYAADFIANIDPDAVTEKIEQLITAFQNLLPVIVGVTAATVAYKAAVAIAGIIDAVKKATDGMTVSQALLNAVMNANPFVLIATLIAGLVAALITLWTTNEDFRNAVVSAWNTVKTSISNAVKAVVGFFTETIPNAASDALEFLMDLPGELVEIGKDLVEGLWEGIKSMGGWIGDKVGGFFGGVVDGIKDFLGIHSPSRVFADMGKNMALGLGEGWDGQYDSIKKNIESGMNFTASVSSTGNVPEITVPAQAQSYVLDALKNINFSIYLDGKTLVGKLAPTIDEQMGTLHVARARGV